MNFIPYGVLLFLPRRPHALLYFKFLGFLFAFLFTFLDCLFLFVHGSHLWVCWRRRPLPLSFLYLSVSDIFETVDGSFVPFARFAVLLPTYQSGQENETTSSLHAHTRRTRCITLLEGSTHTFTRHHHCLCFADRRTVGFVLDRVWF